MKLVGFFNRDGGTFKTTDMLAYEKRAEAAFREAGHDFGSGIDRLEKRNCARRRARRHDEPLCPLAAGAARYLAGA